MASLQSLLEGKELHPPPTMQVSHNCHPSPCNAAGLFPNQGWTSVGVSRVELLEELNCEVVCVLRTKCTSVFLKKASCRQSLF
jgi:hypothetical protein